MKATQSEQGSGFGVQPSFVAEAKALVKVAGVLEPLSAEKACAVMAAACIHFNLYEEAEEFMRMARIAQKGERK